MNRRMLVVPFLSVMACLVLVGWMMPSLLAASSSAGKETVLKAAEITARIFPEKVFYRGQVASVQMRNTGGVRFADDKYVLAGLVDNAGYASDVRQKYQGYLITEVSIEFDGQSLKPGAYGIGFLDGAKFVVTDLGANDVLSVAGKHDAEINHPVPLQVLPASEAGAYRLYLGRDFVEFHRVK
jgi:hypothetical protein